MKTKHVKIENKIATYNKDDGVIVCDNKSYEVEFEFDSEWDAYPEKKASFTVYANGRYERVAIPFSGNVCPIPPVYNTDTLKVGVFVDDEISTSTAAVIPCKLSALSGKVKNLSGFGGGYSGGGTSADYDALKKKIEALDEEVKAIPKEVVNITTIDETYESFADLPADKGNGTTLLVLSEQALYAYDASDGVWKLKVNLRPHTLYCVLTGEKAGMYRYTMSAPYLVSVESHTLEEAKDYTDSKIEEAINRILTEIPNGDEVYY